jgi:hypothetical protein
MKSNADLFSARDAARGFADVRVGAEQPYPLMRDA